MNVYQKIESLIFEEVDELSKYQAKSKCLVTMRNLADTLSTVSNNVIYKDADTCEKMLWSRYENSDSYTAATVYDKLLEACKILYEAVANSEHQLSSRGNGVICKIAKDAIAKAEAIIRENE